MKTSTAKKKTASKTAKAQASPAELGKEIIKVIRRINSRGDLAGISSIAEILSGNTRSQIRYALMGLVNEGAVRQDGRTRNTVYLLPD